MISEEFQIISENGINLNIKTWLPAAPPKALVCMVHGLGEHSERYKHFAPVFNDRSIGIYIMDVRCHGRSEGKRGTGNINAYISDVQELVVTARREYNDLPIFLFGHGFGGLLVVSYLLKTISKEITGTILSSPWLERAQKVSKLNYGLLSFLKYINPAITFSNGISPNDLTNNPIVGEKYILDPLVHDKISVRLFFDIENASNTIMQKAGRLNLPVLTCHGNADSIVAVSGTQKLAKEIPAAELKIWENARHEPHNDFDKEKVIEYYADWIIRQL